MKEHPQLKVISTVETKEPTSSKQRRLPIRSHGFAAYNYTHNTPKLRAHDIDYIIHGRGAHPSTDFIAIESKNPSEEFRYSAMYTLARLAASQSPTFTCYVMWSTEKPFDDRLTDGDGDFSDITVLRIEPGEESDIRAGRFSLTRLNIEPDVIRLIGQGYVPLPSKAPVVDYLALDLHEGEE